MAAGGAAESLLGEADHFVGNIHAVDFAEVTAHGPQQAAGATTDFEAAPAVLFGPDRFHPSARGYAKAAGALLPSVCAALAMAAFAAWTRT